MRAGRTDAPGPVPSRQTTVVFTSMLPRVAFE